jgi:hypothetical protein
VSDVIHGRDLEGTGQSFAESIGRLGVRLATKAWLGKNFPSAIAEQSLLQDERMLSMEINPAALGTSVPAYVSAGKMGAI